MSAKMVNVLLAMTRFMHYSYNTSHASWIMLTPVATFQSRWGLFQAPTHAVSDILPQFIGI